MNSYNSHDIERVIKLVSEYSLRLKDLISLYHSQKSNGKSFILLITITFSLIPIFIFLYLEFYRGFQQEYKSDFTLEIIFGLAIVMIMALSVYMYFSLQRGKRNYRDIRDEARLIKKQLSKLIRIASQTREHLMNMDSLDLLEIDLKLTEAEDIIHRYMIVFPTNHDEDPRLEQIEW